MAQNFLFSVKTGIFYEFKVRFFFCPQPGKRETGTSDYSRTLATGKHEQRRWGNVVFVVTDGVLVKTVFIRPTFAISIHIDQEVASNDFILSSSSDSEVSETEDYELEVEGSLNSSSTASNKEGTQEAFMCR